MNTADEQLDELTRLFPDVEEAVEDGVRYFLILGFRLPPGRIPEQVDALLCPSPRDGYPSRLFLAQPVMGGRGSNWNSANVRILERNWFALSWRVNPTLRLAQMVAAHLEAFR